MEARAVDVGHGWSWFTCGFRIFLQNPGMWIVLGIFMLVVMVVLSLIPFFGGLVLALLSPALTAGLLYAAHAADTQRAVEVGHLFQPFRDSVKTNRLLALGAIALGGTAVAVLIVSMTLGASMMGMMTEVSGPAAMHALGTGVLLVLLIVLAVQLLVTMALIYAIPLVMFRDVTVGEAVRSSFNACVRNAVPLLVFGLIYTVAAIVASIPFLLGWLALLPASAGMLYCSYKDIYEPG